MKSIPAPMTLLMLAIFTTMVGVASTYPPGARFMPFTIGIPAIALCLLQLALDLYRRRHPAAGETELFVPPEALPGEGAAVIEVSRVDASCAMNGLSVTCSSASAGCRR